MTAKPGEPAGFPDHRIVGIAPAVGVEARFADESFAIVQLWGLRADGTVVPLVADELGHFEDATAAAGFERLIFQCGPS